MRTSSRAASASASASPAASRSSPRSSSPTSPSPPSTSPSRPRSSTSWRTSRPSSPSRTCSSPTTSRSCGTSPTGSASCTSAGSSRSAPTPRSTTTPPTPTHALLSAVPVPDPEARAPPRAHHPHRRRPLPGQHPPSGCRFRTRCWKAQEQLHHWRSRCSPIPAVFQAHGQPGHARLGLPLRRGEERRPRRMTLC
ncbi:ABC transporter ATP-binding protein [Streptomyces narbonensis]